MLYLANSFSLSMLPKQDPMYTPAIKVRMQRILSEEASMALKASRGYKSAIGHADTARLIGALFDMEIEVARISITLTENDNLLVAQYEGPRLPEGATSLPEGATIQWWRVCLDRS